MEKSGDLSSKILKAYNTFSSIFIWKEGQSQISQGLFELFSNLQLISIVLSWQFYWQSVTTEGPINRFLKMVCQLLSFRGYFEPTTSHTSYDIAVNLITAYFAVVLLLVGFLAWRSYNQTKVRSRIKKFSIYLAELHHTVLFWMINSVFLALINDRISAAEGSKVIYQGTSMYIVIGIFMPINYIVGFWTASYCYDPFMSRNLFGKSGTTFQISTFWYKAILGFICGLIESEDYKWVFIAASLAITWIRYEVLLRNVYYFEFFTFKCVAILACLGVSFSIGTVILEIVTEYHSDIPWIYLVSLECFIAVLILIITNSRVNNIVIGAISSSSLSRMNHREPKQLRRSHQVYRRLVALSSVYSSAGSSQGLLNKSQNINSDLLYLMGHIGRHKQGDCEYSDCLCKQNEHKGMFGNQDLGDAGLIYAQCEALQTAIANIKDNVQYKIMLISLQCQRKELFARALANIYSLHSMKMTQRQRMLASYICRKLESEFRKFFERSKDEQQAKEENIVDIKRIVDFNTDSEALLKLLEKNSEGYISVWNYYCENEVVLSELLKQMSDHECQAIEVEKRWNSITQRFPNYSLQLYPTYYTYQSLVRNTPMLAEKKILNVYYRRLKMKAFDFNNKIINHIQNNNKENIIFYISVAKESLGKIIYTSNSVHKALGWPQADTIGQNISSFMAPFLGKVYHHRLQYYIEKDTNIVKACRKGFNRTRDGYLFPVYVYITLYPYLNAQPMFFLICSPRVLMSEVLIMSEDGEIDCFTWGIAQRLNLNPNKQYCISQICSEYDKLGCRRVVARKSMEYAKLKTVETEQAFVKEEDMRFSESDSEDDNDEGTESNEELIVTFTPYVSGGLSGKSLAAAANDINYSVRIKVIGRMLCLHLDEQLMPVEKYDDEEGEEEDEEEETNENLEFEDFPIISREMGAGKEDLMTETRKTTGVEGDFPLWSPTQSSTSPLRVLLARPDSAKLLPKGALHSPSQLTSKRSNIFFHQYTVHSSHDSFREVAVRKPKKKTVPPKKLPTKRDMLPASERNSVAGPSRSDLGERLEKAIYHLPQDKLMNILSYFILALVLICCGLVYVYAGFESAKLNTVQKTNAMVSSIQQQQATLLNTITTIQLVMLVNLGIITDTRYASIGVASVRYYMYYKLSYYLAEYVEFSREINDNLNYIDQGLLPELYGDQFDVIYAFSPDSTRKTNNFGLCSDLTSSFTNLGKASLSSFAFSNKDVLFIFNNSMNTPFVTAKRSIQIILSDAKDTLYNVNSVNLTLASLAGAMGALLLVLLFIDFKKFLRRRAYLIEILVRLDQKKILSHLDLTKSFAERLRNKEYDIQDEKDLRLTTIGLMTQDMDHQNGFKASAKNQKNISYKALNNQTIKGLILTSAFIITFISVFVVFSSLYKARLHKILAKMDLMYEINQIGVDMSLVTTGINEYVMNKNSTELGSEPIEEKINSILKTAGSYPLFLASITDSDEYQNEVIAEILQDTLCNVAELVPSPYSPLCKTLANGILDRGLIQMINYLVQGYEATKDTFDSYGHTILAARLALNTKDKVTGELIAGFMVNAYHKIEQILQVQCDELIDNHKKAIKNIAVAYTLIYMILGALLSTKVWKFIKYERLNWRKALRHVPYGIISTNKLLKIYLINNCDNMLDSVKSSLL